MKGKRLFNDRVRIEFRNHIQFLIKRNHQLQIMETRLLLMLADTFRIIHQQRESPEVKVQFSRAQSRMTDPANYAYWPPRPIKLTKR